MSIQHLESAAELDLHATSKLVLMALADDANKITRITYPGMPKLLQWSGAKQRRVQAILEELIVAELLLRRKSGQPGRKAEFIVFPTADEIAKDAAKRAGQVPVDNSESVGAAQCTHENGNGCINSNNGCTPECTPPVRPPLKTLKQSSGLTQVGGPVDNSTDDDDENSSTSQLPTPATVQHRPRHLDIAQIFASTGRLFADTDIDDQGMLRLAEIILGRASSPVINPTNYVIHAIRNDPHEWQREAFALAVDRAQLGGNPF